jgi:hypothetical protein
MKEMEDNYLWDRSGEPDPEVQKLEEILGTLRYQPQPLRIPKDIRVGHRRNFFPTMAIAAVIALFAVLLGLWFSFHRRQTAPALEAKRDSQVDQRTTTTTPRIALETQASRTPIVDSSKPTSTQRRHRESARNLLASNKGGDTRTEIRQPELTPQELAEKEQVLVALRLVSAKLNLAQRKAQGLPQLNTIRNQHKIG